MYKKRALELHQKKYNCCQSVLCAFSELLGIDEKLFFKLSEGFGAGMGNTEGPCGALSAIVLLAGLVNSDGNTENPSSKKSTYILSDEICREFIDVIGSTLCCEIKEKSIHTCDECITYAVEIAEKIIKRGNF